VIGFYQNNVLEYEMVFINDDNSQPLDVTGAKIFFKKSG